MKLSPWYKTEEHTPIRKGWYQCKCCSMQWWWTGKTWSIDSQGKLTLTIDELTEWRGIIK